MDKSLKKEGFRNLSFKSSVAEKFIRYSKEISKSRSMTLLVMIEFFEHNNIAPTESLGPGMQSLEAAIKKRINALIAIIRDIEQNQTIPTKGMLQAIFEELPTHKVKSASSMEHAFKNFNALPPVKPSHPNQMENQDLKKILERLREVKPALGKPYWKLALTSSEINHLKSKYNVHHH